jgi:hypothetical protein
MATESPQPLNRMARHIAYEMAMFVYAASLYPQLMAHEDKGIGSLLFEACLIHFRNLLEFFYGKRECSDDVVATDYVSPDVWKASSPDWLREYKERCAKLLAHPTYKRVEHMEAGTMGWHLDAQFNHLQAEWSAFIEALPAERKAWFGAQCPW